MLKYLRNKINPYTLFCVLFFVYNLCLYAQPGFVWAKQIGSSAQQDIALSLAVDNSENIYTTGVFAGTADFDTGPGVYNLTSASSYGDLFVTKMNSNGSFIWAIDIGGTNGNAIGYSIAVDAYGNTYLSGHFDGTVDFDPGIGMYNLSASFYGDIFICKFSSSGTFRWAKQIFSGFAYSLALDKDNNVYTTGYFLGPTGYFNSPVDFDPGPGTYTLTSDGHDVFVSKLDSSGNFKWAKKLGGVKDEEGYAIAVDDNNNVYTTGYFYGTADFDPGTGTYNLTPTGQDDIFISKLDSTGNFVWAKSMGSPKFCGDLGYGITVDKGGNVYTTGRFCDTVDFDPGSGVYNLISSGYGDNADVFISKLNSAGNFLWARSFGGVDYYGDVGLSIAVNSNNHVFTTGYFASAADFDPGTGVYNLNSSGKYGIFISELDSIGNFICAGKMGGWGYPTGNSLKLYGNAIYITGRFEGTADFDPGPGTYNLVTSYNSLDAFICKLNLCSISVNENEIPDRQSLSVFPNPSSGTIIIRYQEETLPFPYQLKIQNILGEKIFSADIEKNSGTEIDLGTYPKGIYFIEITSEGQTVTKKIVLN